MCLTCFNCFSVCLKLFNRLSIVTGSMSFKIINLDVSARARPFDCTYERNVFTSSNITTRLQLCTSMPSSRILVAIIIFNLPSLNLRARKTRTSEISFQNNASEDESNYRTFLKYFSVFACRKNFLWCFAADCYRSRLRNRPSILAFPSSLVKTPDR